MQTTLDLSVCPTCFTKLQEKRITYNKGNGQYTVTRLWCPLCKKYTDTSKQLAAFARRSRK